MGPGNGIQGYRVYFSSTTIQGHPMNDSAFRLNVLEGASLRDQDPDSQECSSAPSKSRHASTPPSLCTEVRGVEAHPQFKAPQQIHAPSTFPYGTLVAVIRIPQQAGGVLCFPAPSRCIPDYLHVPIYPHKMAAFCCGSGALSVRSSSVRSFESATDSHPSDQGCCRISEETMEVDLLYLDDWLLAAPSCQLLESFLENV